MCNIAGYAGNQEAVPILLEMLRKQAFYDGDMSTGVATLHKGKLYYKKVVGDVGDLWPDDGTLVQHARLVYDLLWQFWQEGRLKKEVRVQQRYGAERHRYYMWLEN